MGLVIDFGLLATIAALAWFVMAERRRFENEAKRLLGKIQHQYERLDNHHRYITVLQDGLQKAKIEAARLEGVGKALLERVRTLEQRKPSITDVDIEHPDPAAHGVPPCPKGPNE